MIWKLPVSFNSRFMKEFPVANIATKFTFVKPFVEILLIPGNGRLWSW